MEAILFAHITLYPLLKHNYQNYQGQQLDNPWRDNPLLVEKYRQMVLTDDTAGQSNLYNLILRA